MKQHLLAASFLVAGVGTLTGGCNIVTAMQTDTICDPGTQITCMCDGRTPGTRTCWPSGVGYGDCVCSASLDGGFSDAGARDRSPSDQGLADMSPAEMSAPDLGGGDRPDATARDHAAPDDSALDASFDDTSIQDRLFVDRHVDDDAWGLDAAIDDVAAADAALTDTAMPDSALPDSNASDLDAALPADATDPGIMDAAAPDTWIFDDASPRDAALGLPDMAYYQDSATGVSDSGTGMDASDYYDMGYTLTEDASLSGDSGGPSPCMDLCDQGDGTVVDSANMLVWRKCSQGQDPFSCTGLAQTYRYCATIDNSCNGGVNDGVLDSMGNSEAWSTCDTLNQAPDSGPSGQGAWRVPSRTELQNFYDTTLANYPDLFPHTVSDEYWSSTAASSSSWAWTVDFASGIANNPDKTQPHYVRCVKNN